MITRLWNLVQFSIYSTRTLFYKYCVAMKYRWICIYFDFERKSTFNTNKRAEVGIVYNIMYIYIYIYIRL